MGVSVYVNGSDISDYVVSVERSHSLCRPISTATIYHTWDTGGFSTYEPVVIYEDGTKVFTGYTQEISVKRMNPELYILAKDPLIRAADTWIDTEIVTNQEWLIYWLSYFLNLSGVSFTAGTTTNKYMPPNTSWQIGSAYEHIVTLSKMLGWYIFSDPDGIIHVQDVSIGASSKTIATKSNILNFKRARSLDRARNATIVFGYGNLFSKQTTTVAGISDERVAVMASPLVGTQALADELAVTMLADFSKIGDEKNAKITGDPNLKIADTVTVKERFSKTNQPCLVTSIESRYQETYEMDITLDERCPSFWGYAPYPSGYYGAGSGIYKSTWGGGLYVLFSGEWNPINGNLPETAKQVYWFDVDESVIFAATAVGLYRSMDLGESYTKIPLTIPSGVYTQTEMVPIGVEIDKVEPNIVWAVAYNTAVVGVYRTEDFGETWECIGL